MKRRFLPISLLLTIIILAQTSFVVSAGGDSGKYSPRRAMQPTAQSFMKSIRANQETGLIDPAWLVEATKNSQSREGELNWSSLGPDNYGSLTRGIVYDNKDASGKTIYIGTMGGGVHKSVNGGITWKSMGENLKVSCLAQTKDGKIFIGTGDGRGAHNQNGFSNLNYENSFVGNGIFMLEGETFTQIENTSLFVNDLAAYENKLYAATNEGIKLYENGSWTTIQEGEAYGVEVCADGTIFAHIGFDIYKSSENGSLEIDQQLPSGETYKIIAASPSDANVVYVAYLTTNNGTGNIYVTNDQGASWQIAYTASSLYDIFGSRGLLDNAMAVYPNNPKKVLIGGLNLWVLRDDIGDGIYRLECLSSGSGFQIPQSGGVFYYNYTYIHYGIQSIVFNPNNVNEFFVGSEGGIFKGTCSEAYGYQFEGKNRYFDDENHSSVTRMFSVGFSGNDKNQALGGSLDHGTIHIIGDKEVNEEDQAGNAIYPNDISTTNAAETYGAFDFTKAGGPCAISTINPNIMFVTTTGANSIGTPLFRTQTAGVDYDKENFSYSATESSANIANSDAFRTPIVLFENYNDTKSMDYVKFVNNSEMELPADTTITIKSHNAEYPFEYTLTAPLAAGDSIEVQDIISTTFLVAVKGKVMMTRDALLFNKVANWWEIGKITGTPNALTISKNGDVAYVGTIDGNLYKAEKLTEATNEIAAIGQQLVTEAIMDSIFTGLFDTTYIANPTNPLDSIMVLDSIMEWVQVGTDTVQIAIDPTVTFTQLDATAFNGQAITSIAIDPKDVNNVIVTLGNYGNTDYIFRSTNGGGSFTSIQGDLPALPIYSSMIEKGSNMVIIGTENGIYTSENMSSWVSNGLTNVPVMEIKQQLQASHDTKYTYLVDEVGDVTVTEFPGIFNEGMIYAATYGKGLYKCDNFKIENSEIGVNENTMVTESFEMSIYPNPIINEATIKFNMDKAGKVSYQVYDLSGRVVKSIVLGNYNEGTHNVNFNVEGLSAGTYIIKVQTGSVYNTSKILVY